MSAAFCLFSDRTASSENKQTGYPLSYLQVDVEDSRDNNKVHFKKCLNFLADLESEYVLAHLALTYSVWLNLITQYSSPSGKDPTPVKLMAAVQFNLVGAISELFPILSYLMKGLITVFPACGYGLLCLYLLVSRNWFPRNREILPFLPQLRLWLFKQSKQNFHLLFLSGCD